MTHASFASRAAGLLLALGLPAGCGSDSSGGAGSGASDAGGGRDATGGAASMAGGGGHSAGGTGHSGGTPSNGGAPSRAAGGVSPAGGAPGTGGASEVDGGSSGGLPSTGGSASMGGGNAALDGSSQPMGYGDFVGVCSYGADDFPGLQALGIRHARFDHPSAELILEARTFGVEILPIANYGFSDLSGVDDQMYPPRPENRDEWAKRMVDKWRTMQAPPKVIEVWNEPWHAGFWKPQPDAPAYLELVKAFAAEAWAVWPNVTLLVSSDHGNGTYEFRKELLAADTGGFLNDRRILPTTHNYVEGRTPTEVTGIPCAWDLDRFECAYDEWKAHGHPDPRVWITEYGWESDTAGGTNAVDSVTEAVQSAYTIDALRMFHDSGKVVKAYAFLYNHDDPWNYNWLRPDDSEKPVCGAVKSLIEHGP